MAKDSIPTGFEKILSTRSPMLSAKNIFFKKPRVINVKPSFRFEFVDKEIEFIMTDSTSSGISSSTYVQYLRDTTFIPIDIDDEINYFLFNYC